MNYKVGKQIKYFSKLKYGDVVFCKLFNGKFELRRYLNANKGTSKIGDINKKWSMEVDTIPLNDDTPHEEFDPETIFEAIESPPVHL